MRKEEEEEEGFTLDWIRNTRTWEEVEGELLLLLHMGWELYLRSKMLRFKKSGGGGGGDRGGDRGGGGGGGGGEKLNQRSQEPRPTRCGVGCNVD